MPSINAPRCIDSGAAKKGLFVRAYFYFFHHPAKKGRDKKSFDNEHAQGNKIKMFFFGKMGNPGCFCRYSHGVQAVKTEI
jgi:hypothetical protein